MTLVEGSWHNLCLLVTFRCRRLPSVIFQPGDVEDDLQVISLWLPKAITGAARFVRTIRLITCRGWSDLYDIWFRPFGLNTVGYWQTSDQHNMHEYMMCCNCLPTWANIFSFSAVSKFPVSLVNCLKPLGHCGHLKLQVVVGSIESAMGFPQCIGRFSRFDKWNETFSSAKFQIRLKVTVFNISLVRSFTKIDLL